MKPTELLQGLRVMKFVASLNGRVKRRSLTQAEAAQILGVSERTFRRWRDREEEEGAEGLYDRRLGKISGRRIAVDLVMKALELFDTRYFDFTSKHFWEKLVQDHGFKVSYNWTRLLLQARGLKQKARSKGAHRRKRPRRALPGMMIHQDGSSHEWVSGQTWDLIVTMDDATSEIYSAFFVEEEGTMSSLRGISNVVFGQRPVFLVLQRPGQPLLAHAQGRRQGGPGSSEPSRPGLEAIDDRAHPGLFARSQRPLGAHVRHFAEPAAAGAAAGGGQDDGGSQPLPDPDLSSPATTGGSQSRRKAKARPLSLMQAPWMMFCACMRSALSAMTTRCVTRRVPGGRSGNPRLCKSRRIGTGTITSRPRSWCTNIRTGAGDLPRPEKARRLQPGRKAGT